MASEELAPRAVGRGLPKVEAPSDEDGCTPIGRFSADDLGDGGLADARFAADRHEAAAAGKRLVEAVTEVSGDVLALDERGGRGP